MKILTILFSLFSFVFAGFFQQQNPWTEAQLMQPEVLASKINKNQLKNTLIYSVGFDAAIKSSVDLGPASKSENLDQLKSVLSKLDKKKEVVIYCGCCPFDRCPNIRPAFKLLQEMGFKNAKLLNLPTNIKTDWLDKGYPSID